MEQPLILVADDNRDLRLIFRTILEASGYRVIEAEDGAEAVRLCREQGPDLIFLDLMMPDTDGWQALAEIQGDDETRSISIVAVTASEVSASELREAGFCAYLRKPVRPGEVAGAIEACLHAAQRGDQWVYLSRPL